MDVEDVLFGCSECCQRCGVLKILAWNVWSVSYNFVCLFPSYCLIEGHMNPVPKIIILYYYINLPLLSDVLYVVNAGTAVDLIC